MGTTQDPGPSRGPGPGRDPAWPGPRARPGVRRPGPRPGGHRHGVAEPLAEMGASAWASASARPEAEAVAEPLRAPLLSAWSAALVSPPGHPPRPPRAILRRTSRGREEKLHQHFSKHKWEEWGTSSARSAVGGKSCTGVCKIKAPFFCPSRGPVGVVAGRSLWESAPAPAPPDFNVGTKKRRGRAAQKGAFILQGFGAPLEPTLTSGVRGAGAVAGHAPYYRAQNRTAALRRAPEGSVYFANTGPLYHPAAVSLEFPVLFSRAVRSRSPPAAPSPFFSLARALRLPRLSPQKPPPGPSKAPPSSPGPLLRARPSRGGSATPRRAGPEQPALLQGPQRPPRREALPVLALARTRAAGQR